MAGFFGRYERSLDAKGRLILPPRLRESFRPTAYLTAYLDGCLALWTADEFERQWAEMEASQHRGTRERIVARLWSSGIDEIQLDSQSRFPIASHLREYARLDGESEVFIVGAMNRLEIWNPDEWQRRIMPAYSELTDPSASEPTGIDTTSTASPEDA